MLFGRDSVCPRADADDAVRGARVLRELVRDHSFVHGIDGVQPENSAAATPGLSMRTLKSPPASGSAASCSGVRPLRAVVM